MPVTRFALHSRELEGPNNMRIHCLLLALSAGISTNAALAQEAVNLVDLDGRWDTAWGETTMKSTWTGYSGTYEEDNGRFVLEWDGGLMSGFWAEDEADEECSYEYMGTRYWGRLQLTASNQSPSFHMGWGYCDDGPIDKTWQFTKRFANKTDLAVFDPLIARLKQARKEAGPSLSGKPLNDYDDDDLDALVSTLARLNLDDREMNWLTEAHFGKGEAFDATRLSSFAEFARSMRVTPEEHKRRKFLTRQMTEMFGVPESAMLSLEVLFFANQGFKNPRIAKYYGGNYENYVAAALAGGNAEFDRQLTDEARQALKKAFRTPDPSLDLSIPQLKPAPEGSRAIDCSFSSVVARMKLADPSFALKWNLYVAEAKSFSFLAFGPARIGGKGAIHKRNVLVQGVRLAIKRCEELNAGVAR